MEGAPDTWCYFIIIFNVYVLDLYQFVLKDVKSGK